MYLKTLRKRRGASCATFPSLPDRETNGWHHYPSVVYPMADIPLSEISHAFGSMTDKYPPILNLKQAAELANLAPSTLKRKVSEGHFKQSVSPGKPLRFWRDRFVREIMR